MTGLDDEPCDDRLLSVAGRLLSELGYDSVTNEMIAEAAGADLTVEIERYGGKRDIYMAVLKGAHWRRIERMRAVEAGYTPDLDGLTRLLEEYLDVCLENPELGAFWMQRSPGASSPSPRRERWEPTDPATLRRFRAHPHGLARHLVP